MPQASSIYQMTLRRTALHPYNQLGTKARAARILCSELVANAERF